MNTLGDIEATLPEQPEPESHLVKIIAVELCSVEELQLVVDLRFKMVVEAEVLKRVDQLYYLDRVNCGSLPSSWPPLPRAILRTPACIYVYHNC